MTAGSGIALAGLIIAMATFIAAVVMNSRTLTRVASSEWVRQLEKRIDDCEEDRKELHEELNTSKREIRLLRGENIELMRKLVLLENGGHA